MSGKTQSQGAMSFPHKEAKCLLVLAKICILGNLAPPIESKHRLSSEGNDKNCLVPNHASHVILP